MIFKEDEERIDEIIHHRELGGYVKTVSESEERKRCYLSIAGILRTYGLFS